ncbi:hypothetical protein VPH35_086309 [Triticum aestivum]
MATSADSSTYGEAYPIQSAINGINKIRFEFFGGNKKNQSPPHRTLIYRVKKTPHRRRASGLPGKKRHRKAAPFLSIRTGIGASSRPEEEPPELAQGLARKGEGGTAAKPLDGGTLTARWAHSRRGGRPRRRRRNLHRSHRPDRERGGTGGGDKEESTRGKGGGEGGAHSAVTIVAVAGGQ